MLYQQEASAAEGQLVRLVLTSRDCAALMPDGGPDAQACIKALESELAAMESELAEADAQHRLYSLLEERTRHACPPYCCTLYLSRSASHCFQVQNLRLSFTAACSGRPVTGLLSHGNAEGTKALQSAASRRDEKAIALLS